MSFIIRIIKNLTAPQKKVAIISVCVVFALVIAVPVSVSASRRANTRRESAQAAARVQITTATTTAETTTQTTTTTEEPTTEPPYVPVKFSDDMYTLKRDGKWSVVNENGDVIINFQYDAVGGTTGWQGMHIGSSIPVGDYLYACYDPKNSSEKWGVVDANNHILVPFEYSSSSIDFSDGIFIGGSSDVYDESGNFLWNWENDISYESTGTRLAGNFVDGLAPVFSGKKHILIVRWGIMGLLIKKKNLVIAYQYDAIQQGEPGSNLIGVKVNQAWGIIDTSGNYIIPLNQEYGEIQSIGRNYIVFKNTILDGNGNVVPKEEYLANSPTPEKEKPQALISVKSTAEFDVIERCNDRAAIIRDKAGAFSGIYINGEIAIPMEYISVSYCDRNTFGADNSSEIFILKKGMTERKIYVARNGRIIEL